MVEGILHDPSIIFGPAHDVAADLVQPSIPKPIPAASTPAQWRRSQVKSGGILRRVKAGVLGGAVPSPAGGLGFSPENKINFALKITQF